MEQSANFQEPTNTQTPQAPQATIRAGWIRATFFFIVFLIVVVLEQVVFTIILSLRGMDVSNMAQLMQSPTMIVLQALTLATTLLLMYVFRRWLDRRSFVSLGFEFGRTEQLHLIIGLVWGVALVCIIFGILLISGLIEIDEWSAPSGEMLIILVVMIMAASQEEFVLRGYMLNNYMTSINKYLALLLVSVLFAASHGANPNVSLVALLNIILAGLLLGVYYVHRKNLWFPVGIHIGWNFFQGVVLGSPVSGLRMESILSLNFVGNEWLTGGEFGFEASLVTSVVLAIATVLIHLQFRQPRSVMPRSEASEASIP